jgi:hypothetical protein
MSRRVKRAKARFIERRLITTADIVDGAIITAKIADAQVTTAKIADGAVTMAKTANLGVHWVKTASPTPGTGGAYGSAVSLTPPTNKSIAPLSASLTWGGTFGTGETVTIRLTATFSDGSTASITKSATATGTSALNPADLQGLMKDGAYITGIAVDSSSSASSTSVTTSATVYGLAL